MRVSSPLLRVAAVIALSSAILAPVRAQRGQPPPVTTVSQLPPPPTDLERLLTRPNTVVSQDVYRVTTDGLAQSFGLVIDAINAGTVPASAAHLQGLRVELVDDGPGARRRISYVDVGELAELSQALAEMTALAARWTAREETRASEAHYATMGGFVVGFRETNRNQSGYVETGVVDPAHHTCTVQDFSVIKTAVDDAITLLRGK